LNALYVNHPALHATCHQPGGFTWLDADDAAGSLFVFMRGTPDGEKIYVVVNATPVPRKGYRLGVTEAGSYREMLNTDHADYGGSNQVNAAALPATPGEWQRQPFSIMLDLPPLGAVFVGRA
jgi:1,4-alpha-glucan branching enzyme